MPKVIATLIEEKDNIVGTSKITYSCNTVRNQGTDRQLCERRLSSIIPWSVECNFLSTSCIQPDNIRYLEKIHSNADHLTLKS